MPQDQPVCSATHSTPASTSLVELTRLWACRLLINGKGCRALDQHTCTVHDDMCEFVGLDPQIAFNDKPHVRHRLHKTLRLSEARVHGWPEPMGQRLEHIGSHLSLDEVEKELLALMTLLTVSEVFHDAARTTAKASGCDHSDLAALALNREQAEIAPLLSLHSRLSRSGLVRLNVQRCRPRGIFSEDTSIPSIELLDGLATALTASTGSIDHLLARYFQRVDLDTSTTLDFDFQADEARRIGTIVDHALASGEHGFNILIHGIPGVGKTEFVRAIAARHGWELYAVSASDDDDQSLTGSQRFRAYQLSQFLLANCPHGVLLFDEIEDVFAPRFTFMFDGARGGLTGKAWTNRMLESNARPVIWVSNGTEALEPAYLRRFDYILRLETPPREVRHRLLDKALTGTGIPATWIEAHAPDADMTPARIAQIGRLGHRLSSALDTTELPAVLDEQIEQHRTVQGDSHGQPSRRSNPLDIYELDYLNTRPSVDALVDGLQHHQAGTVLMHGPPGTGKTAFAEHVAERLGRELTSHSGSALLDKYVGETEKALARMFHQAERAGAVLLLDEADNFLSAREGAYNHWEVTQTNELLVQMERFRGIFLCATNFVSALDTAGMRRFDLKLEFDYLTEPQRWSLFLQLARIHGLEPPAGQCATDLRARLARADMLTPGDFAAVARGHRLIRQSHRDQETLMARLEAEHRMKPGAKQARLGFVRE